MFGTPRITGAMRGPCFTIWIMSSSLTFSRPASSFNSLRETGPGLAICYVFAAHRSQSDLKKLTENNIHQVFIPAGCTGVLQPLDISVNGPFKQQMKQSFTVWYSQQVHEQLYGGKSVEDINVDMRISNLEPVHARWLISAIVYLKCEKDILLCGFEQVGIYDVVYVSS